MTINDDCFIKFSVVFMLAVFTDDAVLQGQAFSKEVL